MKNFRCYELAKTLYTECKNAPVKGEVRDQLLRASLSICLNLIEGSAKQTAKERRRFYYIALGSQRECFCIIELEQLHKLKDSADKLGASLYKLIKSIQVP